MAVLLYEHAGVVAGIGIALIEEIGIKNVPCYLGNIGTVSALFNDRYNRYFRVIVWCKGDKNAVVISWPLSTTVAVPVFPPTFMG